MRCSNLGKPSRKVTNYLIILGSKSTKAERKMLMKLTPGVDFTNIFMPSFCAHGAQKQ